jgi:hypothetical protein
MKVEEFIEFATIEKPNDGNYKLMVYPNLSIANFEFENKIKELNTQGKKFTVTYVGYQIKIDNQTLVFASAENPGSLKKRSYNEVYVHPTIKEVII